MPGTVLESLVVTVGLDSSQYKQGQREVDKAQSQTVQRTQQTGTKLTQAERKSQIDEERQRRKAQRAKEREERIAALRAEKARKQQEKDAIEGAERVQSSVLGVIKSGAGLVLGFEGISGLINFVGNLNTTNAELGRTAANLDLTSHELNRVGNAVALNGGKAEEAQADFAALSQAATNLRLGRGGTELTMLLQRQGVALYDANHKTRDLVQVYEDLADRLQAMSEADRAEAVNRLRLAGVSNSLINYLVLEKQKRKELNDEAERSNRLTDQATARAQKAQKNWSAIKQEVTGGIGAVWDKILSGDWSIAPATAKPALMDTWGGPPGSANSTAPPASDTGMRRNNPGNLKTVGGGEFREFSTLSEGIAAASHQLDLYARRGINTISDIITTYEGKDAPGNHNDVPAYIADVARKTGIPADRPLTAEDRANVLHAMFQHEGSGDIDPHQIAAAIAPTSAAGPTSVATPGAVSSFSADMSRSSRAVTYNTDIGSIHVHSAATDANGIAGDIGTAIQNKNIMMASQADLGQS